MDKTELEARICIEGAFECKDEDGNVLKVITFTGSVPLEQIKEPDDGTNRSQ